MAEEITIDETDDGGGAKKRGGREFLQLEMRKGSVLFRYIYFDNFEGDCLTLTICAGFRGGNEG